MTELTAPVGIGTDNPVATLDIGGGTAGSGGTLHIQEPANPTTITTPVQGAYLAWNALTGGTGETDFINNQGGESGGFAFMNTPASGEPRTTLMFITGTGNVGIGEPSPNAALHLAPGKTLRIEGGTTEADTTDYFSFGGNGTFGVDAFGVPNGRFVVQNGGQVGIGTPTPRTALEIQGPLAAGWTPWLMLTNAVGNADVGVAFNTFAPAVTVANNASSVIQAQDMGNFTNDLVFLSNAGGAPSNGLVERCASRPAETSVSGQCLQHQL
jgi:hypothetical protein